MRVASNVLKSRLMKCLCGSLISGLVVALNLEAQSPPVTYPRDVDIGVAGITLNFRQNAEEVLGGQFKLRERDSRILEVVCQNKVGTEQLTLLHHEGRAPHTFQEFQVRPLSQSDGEVAPQVAVESASDGSEAEAQATAPQTEDAQSSKCILDVERFESVRGVYLGMSLSKLTSNFGERFRVSTQGELTILTYSIESNLSSTFLKYFDALSYYGRYHFRRGRLVEFSFGIDNL